MSDDDNIIEFDFKLTDRRLGTKNEHSKEYDCPHRKVLADKDLKVLECEKCGFIYTPWEYIWRLASKEERIHAHINYAMDEKVRLGKELTDLKRQIRNAKAQLRRASS